MERVYIIHIEMPGASHERLVETGKILVRVLTDFGKYLSLYRTEDRDLIGYALKTTKNARQLRAALEHGAGSKGGSALRNGDRLYIVETGPDYDWIGFGAMDAFLRHRATS
ncbi:MAG TPA: hypothetical protein VND94_00790 [Terriglobia bacterium]|nr:hypothetical protein [Terriglobia bacterium]